MYYVNKTFNFFDFFFEAIVLQFPQIKILVPSEDILKSKLEGVWVQKVNVLVAIFRSADLKAIGFPANEISVTVSYF